MCTSMHYTGDSSVKHRYSEKATNFLKNLLLSFDLMTRFQTIGPRCVRPGALRAPAATETPACTPMATTS